MTEDEFFEMLQELAQENTTEFPPLEDIILILNDDKKIHGMVPIEKVEEYADYWEMLETRNI